MNLFDELKQLYQGKKVLVTGDTGFKGSWLCIWLNEMGAVVTGYALPPLTEKDNFVTTGLAAKIRHIDGDIRDLEKLRKVVGEVQPEIVFHLAAQPLVIDSYKDPRYTFDTNVMGTVNLFEVVRSCSAVKVAVNVTTDKCYQNNEWVWGYRETDPMGGKDPYSASKACSELVTASYIHSFFSGEDSAGVASGRAGNVIGGGDWAENRIVPDIFRAFQSKSSLHVRNPTFVRPWQFVLEPVYGYLKLAMALHRHGKEFSGGWNFGPSAYDNYSVLDVVKEVQRLLPELKTNISKPVNAPHEAGQLRLDISKATNLLDWRPRLDFAATISFTVSGYLSEINVKRPVYDERVAQILQYCGIGN
jgi:CDP-glucose 4,6-dehydratase